MIFKNLLRRKTRTLFTLFGVGIGVAAVVALGAMAEGFINSYSTVLTSSGADLILTQKDASDIIFSSVDESVGQEVATMPGVKQVAGVVPPRSLWCTGLWWDASSHTTKGAEHS